MYVQKKEQNSKCGCEKNCTTARRGIEHSHHLHFNTMAGPRTSYGGRLGSVWIRKKKRRSCDGFHDDQPAAAAADSGVAVVSSLLVKTGACDVQTETTVDVATSGSDTELTNTASSSSSSSDDNADNDVFSTDGSDSSPDAATVTAPTTAPTSSRSTSRRRLIGWDEDLCRPIYEYESVNNPSSASASACSSDDGGENKSDGDDLDKEEDDDASASTEDLSMALSLESSQESLNSSVTNTSSTTRPDSSRSSNRTRSRAARSYGGRKRGRAGLSAAAEAVLLDGEHAQIADDGEQVSKRAAKRTKRETTGAGGKRKVFGGRNNASRAGKPTASAAASPSMTETTLHSDDTTSVAFQAPAYRSMGFEDSMLTPQPYMCGNGNDDGKNICNILDSDVQKSVGAISGSRKVGDVAHVASANIGDGNTKKKGPILDLATKKKASRRQYGGKRLQPRKSTMMAIDDDVFPTTSSSAKRDELDFSGDTANVDGSTRLIQPSGKSSILAARAFFEHLDKTSTLSLENKDELLSPELRRHRRGADGTDAGRCIRTSRRTVDIDSDSKLAREYEQYHQSSLSSDITPLPLVEYVKHRNEFFTSSTTICDGLLDDN